MVDNLGVALAAAMRQEFGVYMGASGEDLMAHFAGFAMGWLRRHDIFDKCVDCGLEADYRCHTGDEVIFPAREGVCTPRHVYPHPFRKFGTL